MFPFWQFVLFHWTVGKQNWGPLCRGPKILPWFPDHFLLKIGDLKNDCAVLFLFVTVISATFSTPHSVANLQRQFELLIIGQTELKLDFANMYGFSAFTPVCFLVSFSNLMFLSIDINWKQYKLFSQEFQLWRKFYIEFFQEVLMNLRFLSEGHSLIVSKKWLKELISLPVLLFFY